MCFGASFIDYVKGKDGKLEKCTHNLIEVLLREILSRRRRPLTTLMRHTHSSAWWPIARSLLMTSHCRCLPLILLQSPNHDLPQPMRKPASISKCRLQGTKFVEKKLSMLSYGVSGVEGGKWMEWLYIWDFEMSSRHVRFASANLLHPSKNSAYIPAEPHSRLALCTSMDLKSNNLAFTLFLICFQHFHSSIYRFSLQNGFPG